jgi:putative ribosome biogenesis GTPase RsgA
MAASTSPYSPDRPQDVFAPGGDVFGHGDYADALVKALTEAPPPFTVGIFGEWGVGKSTIIAAVRSRLREKDDVAFVSGPRLSVHHG